MSEGLEHKVMYLSEGERKMMDEMDKLINTFLSQQNDRDFRDGEDLCDSLEAYIKSEGFETIPFPISNSHNRQVEDPLKVDRPNLQTSGRAKIAGEEKDFNLRYRIYKKKNNDGYYFSILSLV